VIQWNGEDKMSVMNEKSTLVVIRRDGNATVHECEINLDAPTDKLTSAIVDVFQLSGEYDLYVKLQSDVNLSSVKIDAKRFVLMSRDASTKSNLLFK
jgi:hypothetical protein